MENDDTADDTEKQKIRGQNVDFPMVHHHLSG